MSHVVIAIVLLVALTLCVLAALALTKGGSSAWSGLSAWGAAFFPQPSARESGDAKPSAARTRPEATKPQTTRPEKTRPEKTTMQARTERRAETTAPGTARVPEKRILREARTLVQEIEQFLDEQSRLG